MLNSHFQEFIALLEENRVRYLIVGGRRIKANPWRTRRSSESREAEFETLTLAK